MDRAPGGRPLAAWRHHVQVRPGVVRRTSVAVHVPTCTFTARLVGAYLAESCRAVLARLSECPRSVALVDLCRHRQSCGEEHPRERRALLGAHLESSNGHTVRKRQPTASVLGDRHTVPPDKLL